MPYKPNNPRLLPCPGHADLIVPASLPLAQLAALLKPKGLRLTSNRLRLEVVHA